MLGLNRGLLVLCGSRRRGLHRWRCLCRLYLPWLHNWLLVLLVLVLLLLAIYVCHRIH